MDSKEESIRVMLEEINQKTVVGLLVQELIPDLDTAFPWEPGVWNMSDTHATMTHSSTKVTTLRMAINLPNSPADTESGVGQIGSRESTHRTDLCGYQRSRTRRYS